MLRLDEEEDHRRRIRVYLVVRHRRTATVPGGDDPESGVRERGNCPGCTPNCHRGGAVQNHEGRRIVAHCQRTISREERARDQIHHFVHLGGSPASYTRYIFDQHSTLDDYEMTYIVGVFFEQRKNMGGSTIQSPFQRQLLSLNYSSSHITPTDVKMTSLTFNDV